MLSLNACRCKKALDITLATSLVHFFPPKHHTRALRILDDVLSQDPDNISALMGRGYILQHAGKWQEADSMFMHVMELLPDDPNDGVRAKEEHGWCLARTVKLAEAIEELSSTLEMLRELEDREEDKARCHWRLGKAHWELGGKLFPLLARSSAE